MRQLATYVVTSLTTICLLTLPCPAVSSLIASRVDGPIEEALRLKDQGQTAKAQTMLEALLARLPATPSLEQGTIFNALSQIASSRGEYEKSVENARRAQTLFHALKDQAGEAKAFNNAGVAELFKGDYVTGERDFTSSLLLARNIGDHEGEVKARNNLGSLYLYQSRYQDALTAFENAQAALASSSTTEPWHSYWSKITLFNLATLYQRLGSLQRALDIYKQIEKTPDGLSAGDQAHLYGNLGTIYRRLEDPEKAIASYKRAVALYTHDRDSDGELGVLKNIGIVQALELHQLSQALKTFGTALTGAEKAANKHEIVQAHLYRGEILLRMNRISEAKDQFQTALSGAIVAGDTEDRWKALYGIGRIAEIVKDLPGAEQKYREAIAQIEAMRFKIDITALRTGFLAEKRDVYDALIRLLIARNDVPETFGAIEHSRSRVFQELLNKKTRQSVPAVSLQEVQRRLDPATILLEYWLSPEEMGVVWITRDKVGIFSRAVTKRELSELDAAVRTLPESASNASTRGTFDMVLPKEVRDRIDGSIRHITIVPDGLVSLIPFDALSSGTDGRLLVEFQDVSYLPTAMLLAESVSNSTRDLRMPWKLQLVAFGDPIVRNSKDESPRGLAPGKSLPYSGQEIKDIAKVCTGRALQFLGVDDRKRDFNAALMLGAPLLHVSGHAIADYERPELSSLLFSPSENGAASDYVFLREFYAADLHRIDMTVLSACETERATIIRGEGLQGFSRAILAAGSRSAVTSLWRVDDEPTAEFMRQFYYFAVQKHLPRSEALRMAKLKFLHSNSRLSEPRYWAAFVLNGDRSPLRDRFISWPLLTGGVLAILAPIWLALLIHRSRRARLSQPDRYRSHDTQTLVG